MVVPATAITVVVLHLLTLTSHGAGTTSHPESEPDLGPVLEQPAPPLLLYFGSGSPLTSVPTELSTTEHLALIMTLLDRCLADHRLLPFLSEPLTHAPSAVLAADNSAALHRLYEGGIRPLLTGPRPPLRYDSPLYLAWSELLRRCPLQEVKSVAIRAADELDFVLWSWTFFDVFARIWNAASASELPRYETTVALRSIVRRLLNADCATRVLDQYVGDLLIEFVLRTVPQADYMKSMVSKELDWSNQVPCPVMRSAASDGLRRQFGYWLGIGKVRNLRMLQHLEADSLQSIASLLIASHRSAADDDEHLRDCRLSSHLAYGKLYYELMEAAHPCSSNLLVNLNLNHQSLDFRVYRDVFGIVEALAYWLVNVEEYSEIVSPGGPEAFRGGPAALRGLLRVANLSDRGLSDLEQRRRRIYYDLVAALCANHIPEGRALRLNIVQSRHFRGTESDVAMLARWLRNSPGNELSGIHLMPSLLEKAEFRAQLFPHATPQSYLDLLMWIYINLDIQEMTEMQSRFPDLTFAFVPAWMVSVNFHDRSMVLEVLESDYLICAHCKTRVQDIDLDRIVRLPRCEHFLHQSCIKHMCRRTTGLQGIKCPTCAQVIHNIGSM